jgi:hypothetical protein
MMRIERCDSLCLWIVHILARYQASPFPLWRDVDVHDGETDLASNSSPYSDLCPRPIGTAVSPYGAIRQLSGPTLASASPSSPSRSFSAHYPTTYPSGLHQMHPHNINLLPYYPRPLSGAHPQPRPPGMPYPPGVPYSLPRNVSAQPFYGHTSPFQQQYNIRDSRFPFPPIDYTGMYFQLNTMRDASLDM